MYHAAAPAAGFAGGSGALTTLPSKQLPNNTLPTNMLQNNTLPTNMLPSSTLPTNMLPSKQRAKEPVEAAREHAQGAGGGDAAARPGGRPGGGAPEAEANRGAAGAAAAAAGVAGNASNASSGGLRLLVYEAFSY